MTGIAIIWQNFIVPLSAVNRIERTMGKYTYVVTDVVGKEGHHYTLLTSNEYPWMNILIVPTPDEDRDRILAELKKQGGWIAKAEGRYDFVAIHAGGGTKEHPTIKITQQNVNEVRYAGSD